MQRTMSISNLVLVLSVSLLLSRMSLASSQGFLLLSLCFTQNVVFSSVPTIAPLLVFVVFTLTRATS
jgi:hypothetical protein